MARAPQFCKRFIATIGSVQVRYEVKGADLSRLTEALGCRPLLDDVTVSRSHVDQVMEGFIRLPRLMKRPRGALGST